MPLLIIELIPLSPACRHRFRGDRRSARFKDNLFREVIAESARSTGVPPYQVSFKGALQTINQFLPMIIAAVSTTTWIDTLLQSIAARAVGKRPNRMEPRVRKRRPKNYRLMTKPRAAYKTHTAA